MLSGAIYYHTTTLRNGSVSQCQGPFQQKSGVWLLEDHLSRTRRQGAITACAIVTPGNRVITWLINLTSAPLALRKGTKVAVLSQLPITSIQSVVSYPCTTSHSWWKACTPMGIGSAERKFISNTKRPTVFTPALIWWPVCYWWQWAGANRNYSA